MDVDEVEHGMSEPLRIGILGAARIAERALVTPALAGGHRLVAVAARDRDRARAFADAHGVERVVDSYAALLADPEVEVVYNPLANGLHGPWNLAALNAGKHVLSEKPSASNAEEAAEVRDAAEKSGTVFMEAFHYLFHPVTGGCTSCWPPANSASCGMWRPWWPCPHRRTTMCAGRFRWRAAR